jgi:hypothetical protein
VVAGVYASRALKIFAARAARAAAELERHNQVAPAASRGVHGVKGLAGSDLRATGSNPGSKSTGIGAGQAKNFGLTA